MNWLLFLSQLPTNPSSLRVTVWRKMRARGALGLQNGVWMLPDEAGQSRFLQELSELIQKQGASSQTFKVLPVSETEEKDILNRFREDRAEEYAEFKEQCADFLSELQKEVDRSNFSFAEYEENEQDLVKLETWFEKIQKRDFLGGDQAAEAAEWLEKSRQKFAGFADQLIANEDDDHDRKMSFDPGKANDL
ncbi:MAG: Chromate resistance protein ChrB [Anaerolineaceae bacterium]